MQNIMKYILIIAVAGGGGIMVIWKGVEDFSSSGNKRAETKQPNAILIVIDTLRIDHLGCYGYHKATSPYIDQLTSERSPGY